MTSFALILVLFSTFTHALWNYLGKRQNPSASYFIVAMLAGSIFLLPVLVYYRQILPLIPGPIWGLLFLTGICQSVYYIGLAGAYRYGQLSVAYPLVRSLPAFFTPLVCLAFNLGAPISGWGYAGMLLVIVGCLCIPLRSFYNFQPGNYLNWSNALALLAALGTTGYSIIDSEALRSLRILFSGLNFVEIAFVFLALENSCTFLVLGLYQLISSGNQDIRIKKGRSYWRSAAVTGVMISLTYGLVLAAMGYVSNVSYLVAFRELSIPLGAILGITFQKESAPAPKIIGIAIVLIGLVIISLV